ncbi:hypothetical protein GGR50DRAFT_581079 [Xylaria sp. CBS 124048]|nr:hypothetical protein GGR50DRAFT_581079 [Xylaria sp. CBS 124048]
MKLSVASIVMGVSKSALLAFAAILGSSLFISPGNAQATDAIIHHRILEKRDAYTCYGDGANITHCQAAMNQLVLLGDQRLDVYSGVCLNWAHETCNIRFCAQPWVLDTVNRTASWIYNWANNTLMNCVESGQYSLMGDSLNLNGNGGTYRLHIEHTTATHT